MAALRTNEGSKDWEEKKWEEEIGGGNFFSAYTLDGTTNAYPAIHC